MSLINEFNKKFNKFRRIVPKTKKKNTNKFPSGSDLAWILHGVIIAQGFLMLGEIIITENLSFIYRIERFTAIILTLLLSIVDWHIFYQFFYEEKYKWYQWVLDYIILGFLSTSLYFAKTCEYHPHLYLISFFGYVALTLFSYALMWNKKQYKDKKSKNEEEQA